MTEAFYQRLDATRVRSTPHTNGPWQEGLQHAGPPAALLLRAVRELPGLPARLSYDIFAPVPVADLLVTSEILRPGRKVALVQASLAAADAPERPLMRLTAWLLRQAKDVVAATPVAQAPAAPGSPMARAAGWHAGYLDAIAWSWVDGAFEQPGPATVWTQLLVDLVEGEPTDPLDHLAIVADSASGISAVASPRDLLFVNTDLTLHLTRMPTGEAIWLRAQSALDPAGVGRANGELGDGDGLVATSAQCLFVDKRVDVGQM